MRIDTLTYNNIQTQGAKRREWLRQHSPQHLEHCAALILHALQKRPQSTSRSTLVLGAGACTEIPLDTLARASDEVVLVDLDLASMQQAQSELASPALRKRIHLLQCDISGGISANLNHLIQQQPWETLLAQGSQAIFNAAAHCIEQCPIPDPPQIQGLGTSEFGLVISSLVLSQLFSYPLLDVLDHVQRIAPNYLGDQEHHHRYQEAAQALRTRIIQAHLHLLQKLADQGGLIVLLSDIRGFVFNTYGTNNDTAHRPAIPLVPRSLPDLIRSNFTVLEESHWEWFSDLPEKNKPGRGYEVAGYLLT